MSNVKIGWIRQRLADYQPTPLMIETSMRAAVALLLQPQQDDLRVLFIHRAQHPLDPWSGHMAFPGGMQDPGDADLLATIQRETKEEVGIDLLRYGEHLGRLAEVQPMARGRLVSMTVTPFVYLVSPEVSLTPDPVEVQDTIWVPLSFMQQDGIETLTRHVLPDNTAIEVPALLYGGKTIWGLTYRVLRGFLELIIEK
ncbi:MAG: NUDIX hydrolase [Candidatus Binatia bacterium]